MQLFDGTFFTLLILLVASKGLQIVFALKQMNGMKSVIRENRQKGYILGLGEGKTMFAKTIVLACADETGNIVSAHRAAGLTVFSGYKPFNGFNGLTATEIYSSDNDLPVQADKKTLAAMKQACGQISGKLKSEVQ